MWFILPPHHNPTESSMRVLKLKNCKRASGVHFAPDGRTLLAVGGYEAGQVDTGIALDLTNGAELYRVDGFLAWYAVDPGLTRFVTGEKGMAWKPLPPEGKWRPVEVSRGKEGAAANPIGIIYTMALDAGGGRLAFSHGRETRDVRRYGLGVVGFEPGATPTHVPLPGGAHRLAFDASGKWLAYSGDFGRKTGGAVYDLSAGRVAWEFGILGNQTRSLAFLPDGRLAAANMKSVYIYREGGDTQFALAGHAKQVNAVAVSPDGRRVLSGSGDGTVRVWDTTTGAEVAAYDWKVGAIGAVAYAPDGLTAAAGSATSRVVVWDVDG
jgi:WD40 repeat protein